METEHPVRIKQEPADKGYEPFDNPAKRKLEEDEPEDEASTLTLMGDISVPRDGSKLRKQKKRKKEFTEEKIAQLDKEKVCPRSKLTNRNL